MIRFATLAIFTIFSLAAFQSCNKQSKSDCSFIFPDIVYINFTEEETDTLILRRYEKDAEFANLIDTVLIPKGDIIRTIIGRDSVVLNSASEKYHTFNHYGYNYDWELDMPGITGFPVRITGIEAQIVQEKAPSTHCHSFITNMHFHLATYSWQAWLKDTYKVYLTKETDPVD